MTNTAYDQYCVVRYYDARYALPANTVREVMLCPGITSLPNTSPVLQGIAHVNNEFLTITDPFSIVIDRPDKIRPRQLLVVTGGDGPWGVLVDEVVELTGLEDYQPHKEVLGHLSFMGTATHQGHRLKELDVEETYRSVMSELKSHWQHCFRNLELAQET
jgi:chemotaxis signal transduction protein